MLVRSDESLSMLFVSLYCIVQLFNFVLLFFFYHLVMNKVAHISDERIVSDWHQT